MLVGAEIGGIIKSFILWDSELKFYTEKFTYDFLEAMKNVKR